MTLPNRDGDMHTPSAALLLDDSTAVVGHAPFEESAARVPGRSRSDPLGPRLDSPTRNSGVTRNIVFFFVRVVLQSFLLAVPPLLPCCWKKVDGTPDGKKSPGGPRAYRGGHRQKLGRQGLAKPAHRSRRGQVILVWSYSAPGGLWPPGRLA
jgi:hypothetical protein